MAGEAILNEIASTPATPSSGDAKLYFKTDDVLYTLDSSGVEKVLSGVPSVETLDLGGANGSISPTDKGVTPLTVFVDAGGSAVNLEGIDGIATHGQQVVIQHTGGEAITVQDASGATNPFDLPGDQNITLDANGQWIALFYDSSEWVHVARDPALTSIRNKGTEAGAIDTNTSGAQSVTVSHGLDVTPAAEDITVVITNGPNNGENLHVQQVRGIGSSQFTVDVDVESTSGGSGESADLSWQVNAGVA